MPIPRVRAAILICLAIASASLLTAKALAADEAKLSGKVLVLAAASTTEAFDEVRAEFTRLHPAVTIQVSYGPSSALAQQIKAGAGAALFLSASTEWAEFLAKAGLV